MSRIRSGKGTKCPDTFKSCRSASFYHVEGALSPAVGSHFCQPARSGKDDVPVRISSSFYWFIGKVCFSFSNVGFDEFIFTNNLYNSTIQTATVMYKNEKQFLGRVGTLVKSAMSSCSRRQLRINRFHASQVDCAASTSRQYRQNRRIRIPLSPLI